MTDNPKDIVGSKKVPLSVVPAPVIMEVAVGMYEGATKYGPYNWRESPVKASIYYDATIRHLMAWHEGEDIDPDSGLSHITKAITSLVVLRDAMMQGTYKDDRPIRTKVRGWMKSLNDSIASIAAKHALDCTEKVRRWVPEAPPVLPYPEAVELSYDDWRRAYRYSDKTQDPGPCC